MFHAHLRAGVEHLQEMKWNGIEIHLHVFKGILSVASSFVNNQHFYVYKEQVHL